MSVAFSLWLLYCSEAIPYIVLAWIIAIIPRCLLCAFALISNRSMGRSMCDQHSLVSLWIRRSRTLWWRFGEYPVYHGKLNIRQPI